MKKWELIQMKTFLILKLIFKIDFLYNIFNLRLILFLVEKAFCILKCTQNHSVTLKGLDFAGVKLF
jgi:hypothetical protein